MFEPFWDIAGVKMVKVCTSLEIAIKRFKLKRDLNYCTTTFTWLRGNNNENQTTVLQKEARIITTSDQFHYHYYQCYRNNLHQRRHVLYTDCNIVQNICKIRCSPIAVSCTSKLPYCTVHRQNIHRPSVFALLSGEQARSEEASPEPMTRLFSLSWILKAFRP